MRSKNRNFKLVAAGTLLCVTTCAMSITPTHAANGWEIDLKNYADTLGESSISISIGGANNEILNADKGIAQGMIKQTANVEFGATNGYTVKISGTPNLTGASTKATIPSAALTLGNMVNQWGWYAVNGAADCGESSVYKTMTTEGTQIDSGVLADGGTKTYTMCFGMRVNGNQVADTYNGSVTVSVVAEPGMVRTAPFSGITYMQDMTANICKLADENETAQLIDRRDDKKYWVTKMLDGNCWMSQNLDLDLSTNKSLTSTDSDVASSWTPGQTTSQDVAYGGFTDSYANHLADTYSWDLGRYVLTSPKTDYGCALNNVGLGACTEQVTSVDGWMASGDPNFYKTKGNSIIDENTKTYDAHYLIGNLYQWNTATAGTGASTVNGTNAVSSICPKNWKLPGSVGSATEGVFEHMLSQYGVQSKINTVAGAVPSPVDGNEYDVARSPLFFVRGGVVYPIYSNGKFGGTGGSGYYWSAQAYSDTSKAYYLQITNTDVKTSDGDWRYNGHSIRCLVPTT